MLLLRRLLDLHIEVFHYGVSDLGFLPREGIRVELSLDGSFEVLKRVLDVRRELQRHEQLSLFVLLLKSKLV
jgi:hypothetical protein